MTSPTEHNGTDYIKGKTVGGGSAKILKKVPDTTFVPTEHNSEVYATLKCKNCGESWDITFENTSYPPSEYAMAIEQKENEPCPDCGGELEIV